VPPIDKTTFARKIQQSLVKRDEEMHELAITSTRSRTFKSVIRHKIIDLGDAKSSGWTYLVNENDPNKNAIIKILKPLAEHRGMSDPEEPLLFNDKIPWQSWLQENYHSLVLRGKTAPHYILIIGEPNMVPFLFQSMFDCAASVGRVAFDDLQDLQTYVDKIVNIEKTEKANPKEAIVFAPDYGIQDVTYYTHKFMAKPLANYLQNELKANVKTLLGKQATKENLSQSLKTSKPALVYTAGHGLVAPDSPLSEQKRINGGICCEQTGDNWQDWVFTADDVPGDQESFLEGSIFFQFACYGYGTPAESDYEHWFKELSFNSSEDFIAALPKRLLAHPKGPVAYIGHLDTAFLDAFDDPNPDPFATKWHNRMSPFVYAVNKLLGEYNPVGISMEDMNKRYNVCNVLLTSYLDEQRRLLANGKAINWNDFFDKIIDIFILRSDAQNYMVFGDPAARLLIK
jgi:hypothetical protein